MAGTRGHVENIWASPSSMFVMFSLREGIPKTVRCNTSRRYSIHLGGPGGEASYSALLLAFEHEYPIEVESLNTCNGYDAENIKFIVVKRP